MRVIIAAILVGWLVGGAVLYQEGAFDEPISISSIEVDESCAGPVGGPTEMEMLEWKRAAERWRADPNNAPQPPPFQ